MMSCSFLRDFFEFWDAVRNFLLISISGSWTHVKCSLCWEWKTKIQVVTIFIVSICAWRWRSSPLLLLLLLLILLFIYLIYIFILLLLLFCLTLQWSVFFFAWLTLACSATAPAFITIYLLNYKQFQIRVIFAQFDKTALYSKPGLPWNENLFLEKTQLTLQSFAFPDTGKMREGEIFSFQYTWVLYSLELSPEGCTQNLSVTQYWPGKKIQCTGHITFFFTTDYIYISDIHKELHLLHLNAEPEISSKHKKFCTKTKKRKRNQLV